MTISSKLKCDRIPFYEEALITAKNERKNRQVIRLLQILAILYTRENRHRNCIACLLDMLSLIEKKCSPDRLAFYHRMIANSMILNTDFIAAEDHLKTSLHAYQKFGNQLGIACVYLDYGRLYRENGQVDLCMKYLTEAFSIFSKYPDQLKVANSLVYQRSYDAATEILGGVLITMKLTDKGSNLQADLLERMKITNDLPGITRILQNIGAAHCYTDPDKALQYLSEALDYAEKSEDAQAKAIILSNMGLCHETKGNFANAIQVFEEALQLMNKHKLKRYCANALNNLASTYQKMGNHEEATYYALQSLNLADTEEVLLDKHESYWILCGSYKAEGKYEQALDYVLKYCEINDKVFNMEIANKLNTLQREYDVTSQHLAEIQKQFSLITDSLKKSMEMNFIGVSSSIKQVYQLALKASAYTNTNVIVTGESGVGKEIVARLIHYAGSGKKGPFVDVNCSAIIESLAESEFFGYAKGSFTGANSDKTGVIESAIGGTLFLDEIADTPLPIQAKLLRVLETRSLKKVGSNKPVKVDFRLISATNKTISELIKEGLFRADLLYRINTIEIHIPPLRERKDDIEPLLNYFLKEFARKMNKPVPHYSSEFLDKLCDYPFPGNVRELKNKVERAMITLDGDELRLFDMGMTAYPGSKVVEDVTKFRSIQQMEIDLIEQALEKTGGNYIKASAMLGISYSTIRRKLNGISTKNT